MAISKLCSATPVSTRFLTSAVLLGMLLPVLSGCVVDERLDRSAAQVPHRLSWSEKFKRIQDSSTAMMSPNIPVSDSKDILGLIEEIDRRTTRVKTVGARLKVKITNDLGKSMNLDASYIGDSSGNFRLRLTGIFGILGLDMAMADERLVCYLPTRKTAFVVPEREMSNCASVELGLISELGRARELFSPRAWAARADARKITEDEHGLQVNVMSVNSASSKCLRRIQLNPLDRNIASEDVFRPSGDLLGRAEYVKFVSYQNLIEDRKNNHASDELLETPVAQSVRLTSGNGKLTLEFEVESLRLNDPINPAALEIDIPSKIHVETLAEALASGRGLFEP